LNVCELFTGREALNDVLPAFLHCAELSSERKRTEAESIDGRGGMKKWQKKAGSFDIQKSPALVITEAAAL
jgi:hypothetical protein